MEAGYNVIYADPPWAYDKVKDGSRIPSQRKLKPSQQKFMADFAGCPVFKVENVLEALSVHGIGFD